MSDERWQRIEELFHHAADLAPANRSAYLATACAGDPQLRREVESLLAQDDSQDGMLAGAVAQAVDHLPGSDGEDLVGKQIGPYQISSLIGKGGMGLVFKARDTQLNRSVAIKMLPPDHDMDPDRKRRFLREAKSASALSHPNIVTVHNIVQEHGSDFLVMEYLAGQTLDHLIRHPGLSLKQAVKYGMEIADALAAAHSAGIVHRDIKPSNIMVTENGRVKVLDFGLAKLTQPVDDQAAQTGAHDTKAGLVFGTAAYMSPEQAQGKPADARSDIFSFGALLYEMVTGQRAFQGENVISILAAVLNQEPPPIQEILNVPRELEWIVARCLKKEPDRRIQHMVDVKLALQEVLEKIDAPSQLVQVSKAKPVRRIWWTPAFIAFLLAAVPGAWFGYRLMRQEPVTFQRLTFRRGDVTSAKFAPGGAVVYAASWEGAPNTLFSAQPGNRDARELGLPHGDILSISTTGEMAVLIDSPESKSQRILARVPWSGGTPREVLDDAVSADWDPTGKALAVIRTKDGHHRVEYPIGTVLYQTDAGRPPPYVRVSPRGDLVAFFEYADVGDYSLSVAGANLPRKILSRGWRAVGGLNWSPDGKELWFQGGRPGTDPALYAVNLSGQEHLLLQTAGYGVLHDVGRDGRVLMNSVNSRIGIRCLAPGAKEESDLAWQDASLLRNISKDGKQILFTEMSDGEGRNLAIYLRGSDGSPAVKLGYGNQPALSPNGKWVLCVRRDAERTEIQALPTGAGEAQHISTGGIRVERADWFPDSKQILVTGVLENQLSRTFIQALDGSKPRAFTPQPNRVAVVSPDGANAIVIRGHKLFLLSLATGTERPAGELASGDSVIRWSGDGQFLFLQRNHPDKTGATILRLNLQNGQSGVWRELKVPEAGAEFLGVAKVSADGQAYAFSFQRDLSTLYLLKGVR